MACLPAARSWWPSCWGVSCHCNCCNGNGRLATVALPAAATVLQGPVAEQVLLLENIATAVLAGPDQLPSLHRLLMEAAAILEMEAPELYVRQVRQCGHPLHQPRRPRRRRGLILHGMCRALLLPACCEPC